MKAPLFGLSLAANVVLVAGVAYLALAPSAADGSKSLPVTGPDTPQASATAAGAVPAPSRSLPPAPEPGTWQSPTDLNAWLLSTHAPLKVRYAVAEAAVGKKYSALVETIRFPPTMKRWQRSTTSPTPEQREQQAALWRQQEEEMKHLFGADYAQARYDENAASRAGLSVEKYAALQQIRQDYMQIRMKQLQNRTSTPGTQRLLDDEMTADVAKILTPEELELHQAYESQEAQALQGSMTGLDVDDDTYLRAYRAAAEARAANPQADHGIRRDAELQAIEKAVGTEISRHVAMNNDGNFGEFNRVFSNANLSAAARYEKYQTFKEFQETLGRLRSTLMQGRLDAAYQAKVRAAYERLTAGLPPAAQADFDRTPTGTIISRALAQPLP